MRTRTRSLSCSVRQGNPHGVIVDVSIETESSHNRDTYNPIPSGVESPRTATKARGLAVSV